MKVRTRALIQNRLLELLEHLILAEDLEYNRFNVDCVLKGFNWKARGLVDYRNEKFESEIKELIND